MRNRFLLIALQLIYVNKYALKTTPRTDCTLIGCTSSLTIIFKIAASHGGFSDPDGFRRGNLPISSPTVLTNTPKSMSGSTANSLLTQVALTSPEHSILHRSSKLCTSRQFKQIFCFFCFLQFCLLMKWEHGAHV